MANFDRKEHLQHRAVSLRKHGFLVFTMLMHCQLSIKIDIDRTHVHSIEDIYIELSDWLVIYFSSRKKESIFVSTSILFVLL